LQRDLVYQANGRGVFFIGLSQFKEVNSIVSEYEIKITNEGKTKLLQWCVDNSGKKYGFLQLAGIVLKRIMSGLGFTINNPFSNATKQYICTELVYVALKEAGINLPRFEDLDSLGIKDLEQMVEVLSNG
jgi:uncharacterized protein YycO